MKKTKTSRVSVHVNTKNCKIIDDQKRVSQVQISIENLDISNFFVEPVNDIQRSTVIFIFNRQSK